MLRRAFKLANKARLKSDSERNRVYVEHLRLKDFRSFREGSLTLNIPAKRSRANLLSNVNVILGNNGDGKSSILRAVALACLGPSLRETGFVPYRLVRRPRAKFARISADVILSESELITAGVDKLTLDCDILRRGRSDNDLITSDDIDYNLFQGDFFDDSSDAMFLVGYGATRAVETSDYSEGTALKSRGARYQRVAGLFEDHVRLVPFHRRRLRRARSRMPEMIKLLNRTLPPSVKCSGLNDQEDLEFIVSGVRTPFASLSDGFKAFAGWVADFLGRLADELRMGCGPLGLVRAAGTGSFGACSHRSAQVASTWRREVDADLFCPSRRRPLSNPSGPSAAVTLGRRLIKLGARRGQLRA